MKKVILILVVFVSLNAYCQNFDTNPIEYMDSLVLKNIQPSDIDSILPLGFKIIEQTYKYMCAEKKTNNISQYLEFIYKNSNLIKVSAILGKTNVINDINNLPYKKMGTSYGVNPENLTEKFKTIMYCRNDNLTTADISVWSNGSVELYVKEYELYDY